MTTDTRLDLPALHRAAVDRFARQVDALEPQGWARATPCDEWNVRALVNHVLVENLWTAPLLAGSTIAMVGDAFDGDCLGDDPAQAFRQAATEAVDAVTAPGALHRTVHLSFGETAATEYVWQLFADHLVHSWDLARAVGGDDRLDAEQVAACAGWFADQEGAYRAAGAIGPPRDPAGNDPQARLLARFGRAG